MVVSDEDREREARDARVLALGCQGYTRAMIAVELGMTLGGMAALEASDPQFARAMKAAEGGRIDWWGAQDRGGV